MLGDTWLDGPEVRQAISLMGGIEAASAAPDQLLELVGQLREAAEDTPLAGWLREHRLAYRQLVDLLAAAATPAEEPRPRAGEVPCIGSREARAAVVALDLHEVDSEAIARLLDLDEDVVERYLAGRRGRPGAKRIMALHYEGQSVVQIAQQTGVSTAQVYRVLGWAREEPNVQVVEHVANTQAIVRLRNEGRTYAEIRKRTGANTNQIRNALRRAAAKGKLVRYGKASA